MPGREDQPTHNLPASINWGGVLAFVIAAFGIITGANGHWREWWVIAIWPIVLILSGLGLNQWLRKHTSWIDDNIFSASAAVPLVLEAIIGFAYICTWPSPEQEAKIEIDKAPKIAVTVVTPPIHPKDPFGSRFLLQSHSPESIYDVSFDAYWNDPIGLSKRILFENAKTDSLPELGPFGERQLRVSADNFPHAPLSWETMMIIEARFASKDSKRFTNYYKFRSSHNSDGDYGWLPEGPGETREQMRDEINKRAGPRVKPLDKVPFIDLKIISIDEITTNTGWYGIAVKFTSENIGADIADNVIYNWQFAKSEPNGSRIWGSQSRDFRTSLLLIPGGIDTATCPMFFSSNSISRPSYEDILLNKMKILGRIRFRDASYSNNFENTFELIHTNSDYFVHYTGFLGDFNEFGITNEASIR